MSIDPALEDRVFYKNAQDVAPVAMDRRGGGIRHKFGRRGYMYRLEEYARDHEESTDFEITPYWNSSGKLWRRLWRITDDKPEYVGDFGTIKLAEQYLGVEGCWSKSYRSPRDSQRKKVYDSENAVARRSRFDRLESNTVQQYIDELREQPWWRPCFGDIRPVYEYAPLLHRTSHARGNKIRLAPGWGHAENVIIHEIAHVLSANRPAHGRFYTATLLFLYDNIFPKHAPYLRAEFERRGVSIEEIHLVYLQRQANLTVTDIAAKNAPQNFAD